MSKAYWELKEEDGRLPDISGLIVRQARPYNCGSRRCNLRLEEKLTILQADEQTLRLPSINGLSWLRNAVTVTKSSQETLSNVLCSVYLFCANEVKFCVGIVVRVR